MKKYFPTDDETPASQPTRNGGELDESLPLGDLESRGVEGQQRIVEEIKVTSHRWTIVHSYFATMGGFAVQVSDENGHKNFFPWHGHKNFFSRRDAKMGRYVRLTLTPEGLLYLEERFPGIIPNLSRTSIEDKSKGSMFAKSVVCFQG
jgi:hypothetical protein